MMQKDDVVYILKNDYTTDEVYYSIRSVCKNFPHRHIWIFGGMPEGIDTGHMVSMTQFGSTKWSRVSYTLRKVCEHEDVSDDFWLFNDDFFIMQKIRNFENRVGGSLWARIDAIEKKHNGVTKYSQQLRETARTLKENGYDRLDYALHCPLHVNKAKALETLDKFPGHPMFRSLYGNHHKIGGVLSDDVKVFTLTDAPAWDLLSTTDRSWNGGKVGEYIRNAFPERCKYETRD